MFILENASTFQEEFNNFPEITDWSNDSYNILAASLFFNEALNNITQATAIAEVVAYNEGTIESFNESAFETVKNKIKQLWAKFKAFVLKVRDRFMAWVRKTFMSNGSFWNKYGSVIEDNMGKLERKNPKISAFDIEEYADSMGKLDQFNSVNYSGVKDTIISKYNDDIETLGDYKKDVDKALNTSEEFTVKELISKCPIQIGKNAYKDLETYFKNGHGNFKGIKQLEDKIKETEKNIKDYDDQRKEASSKRQTKKYYGLYYSAKIEKEYLSASLTFTVRFYKKLCNIITKIGYEAVKLQNTKEEDIKEESASIDLLNKYLQRI